MKTSFNSTVCKTPNTFRRFRVPPYGSLFLNRKSNKEGGVYICIKVIFSYTYIYIDQLLTARKTLRQKRRKVGNEFVQFLNPAVRVTELSGTEL